MLAGMMAGAQLSYISKAPSISPFAKGGVTEFWVFLLQYLQHWASHLGAAVIWA